MKRILIAALKAVGLVALFATAWFAGLWCLYSHPQQVILFLGAVGLVALLCVLFHIFYSKP
jgi:hypothetical protein